MELPWQIDDAIFAHFAVQLSVYVTCSGSSPYSQPCSMVGRTGVVAITLTQQRRDKTRRGDACNRPETLKRQVGQHGREGERERERVEMRALDNAVIYSGFVYLRFYLCLADANFHGGGNGRNLALALPLPLALA